MNWLKTAIVETAAQPCANESLSTFRRSIDPLWIEEALEKTGTATLRRRRLPAEQVLWLVLGMALLRDRPIDEIVEKLDLVMPDSGNTHIAKSSIVEARGRLGAEPLQWLFQRCSEHWALASAKQFAWRGLSVFAVDGTTLRVPDSEENRSEFGLARGGTGQSGYPLARLVAVIAARSHLILKASIGPNSTSEHALTDQCLSVIPDDSITIFDKNFLVSKYMAGFPQQGTRRHWLMRAKSNTRWRVLQELGPGDFLVELKVHHRARRKNSSLPKQYQARAICYQRPDSQTQQWLLTSVVESKLFPAGELIDLYHERWEIEIAYDEIKTHLLEREESIRSRTSQGVYQELWGILLAYNMVRLEMVNVAKEAKVAPTRISFMMATRFIRDEWSWCAVASPGSIPSKLRRMRKQVADFILPPRRSERRYPREVKIVRSKYPKKKRPSLRAPPAQSSPKSTVTRK